MRRNGYGVGPPGRAKTIGRATTKKRSQQTELNPESLAGAGVSIRLCLRETPLAGWWRQQRKAGA
jgi:hypothetical protein